MSHLFDKNKSLYWACRRGMLELDIVLNRFLNEHYLSLSTEQQMQFRVLLTYSDTELYDWLIKRQWPDALDPAMATLREALQEMNIV